MAHYNRQSGIHDTAPENNVFFHNSAHPFAAASGPGLSKVNEDAANRDDGSLYKNTNPNRITTSAPGEDFRLGVFSVMCLIGNRMIGEFNVSC